MTRTILPTRRPNETREVEFDGSIFTVCIGYDWEGYPKEVFADGPKDGSTMQAFIDDTCVLISIALQHGITPKGLAHSLGVVPAFHDGAQVERHASPVGVIVAALEPLR